jgi:hypothetical protein
VQDEEASLGSSEAREVEFEDPPRKEWLGHAAPSTRIGWSGLWNVNHVDERYHPSFLEVLWRYIADTTA